METEMAPKEITLKELRDKKIVWHGSPAKERRGIFNTGVYFALSIPDGDLYAIEIQGDRREIYRVRDRMVKPADKKTMLRYATKKGLSSGYTRINPKLLGRLRRYFEGRLLVCPACGYEWSSLSHAEYYTCCPRCRSSVKRGGEEK